MRSLTINGKMELKDLRVGMYIWHESVPFKLVLRTWKGKTSERWIVLPLFTGEPERKLVICAKDRFYQAHFHSGAA